MTHTYLSYPLAQGFIDHWLAAGPVISPGSLPVAQPPADLEALDPAAPEVCWRYVRCLPDHWLDLTAFYPTPSALRARAFAVIDCPGGGQARLRLALEGCQAQAELNGQPLAGVSDPAGCAAVLAAGRNEILLLLDASGSGEVPLRAALRIDMEIGADCRVLLPTTIEPGLLEARQRLEQVTEAAFLDRYVYGFPEGDFYHKNEPVVVRYSPQLDAAGEITHRLQSLAGDIFQESTRQCSAGAVFEMAKTFPLRSGPHHLALLPPAKEYYVHKLQFERKDLFYVVRTDRATRPHGTLDERRAQALDDASQRRGGSLFTEIARMSLDRWDQVEHKLLARAVQRIADQAENSALDLLAVLGLLARFGARPELDGLRQDLVKAAAAYRYPGAEIGAEPQAENESRELVLLACEVLAGQRLARRSFSADGRNGREHRLEAETRALAWMAQRGRYGFARWNSPDAADELLAGLAHLVELASSRALREMAAALMDKVLFNLALHCWGGAYGAARGYSGTPGVLSPRLEPTAGICRLVWGLGNFNDSLAGTVSLALCRAYQPPVLLEQVALGAGAPAAWTRQRDALPGRMWGANTSAYRTRDFMLSCAHDYRPGLPGRREHIWQAVMGPDAVVFTNHPANCSVETQHGPNLWAGNRVLPRAAQWGDVVLALYRLPADDWMGYTHAYFPAHAFDEYSLEGGWAFARKDQAYLALRSASPMQWITAGKTALRELRSDGLQNAWVCHMGQQVLDGSFSDFRLKVLALDVSLDGSRAALTSLRGERLEFGWDSPLLVDGAAQPFDEGLHYQSPYCTASLPAAQVDIVCGEEGMRLRFE